AKEAYVYKATKFPSMPTARSLPLRQSTCLSRSYLSTDRRSRRSSECINPGTTIPVATLPEVRPDVRLDGVSLQDPDAQEHCESPLSHGGHPLCCWRRNTNADRSGLGDTERYRVLDEQLSQL